MGNNDDEIDIREVMKKAEAERHPSLMERAKRIGAGGVSWVKKEIPTIPSRLVGVEEALVSGEIELERRIKDKNLKLQELKRKKLSELSEEEKVILKEFMALKKREKALKGKFSHTALGKWLKKQHSKKNRRKLKKVV